MKKICKVAKTLLIILYKAVQFILCFYTELTPADCHLLGLQQLVRQLSTIQNCRQIFLLSSSRLISYDLMKEPAVLQFYRFSPCGCNSREVVSASEHESKRCRTNPKLLSGVWTNMLIYIARFPLCNKINATQTDSSVKALKSAVKNASDYYDVDVCMSSAVQ